MSRFKRCRRCRPQQLPAAAAAMPPPPPLAITRCALAHPPPVRLIGYVGTKEPLKVFQNSKLQAFSIAVKLDARKAAADSPTTWCVPRLTSGRRGCTQESLQRQAWRPSRMWVPVMTASPEQQRTPAFARRALRIA